MGCSFTLGVGVDEDQTWPHYLGQILGMNTVNLGQGGSSPAQVWVNSLELLRAGIRPRAVAYYWPEAGRSMEFDSEPNRLRQYGSWSLLEAPAARGDQGDLGQAWAAQDPEQSRRWAGYMAQSIPWDCPRVDFTWSDSFRSVPSLYPRLDLARDLIHPGPQSHWVVAQNMALGLRI